MILRGLLAILLTSTALTGLPTVSSPMSVTGLRAGYLENPLGVDDPAPDLSWRSTSRVPGRLQSAYQVQAASTVDRLRSGAADLWDSGRIASASSYAVPYAGRPTHSRQRVFWRVRVWDQDRRVSAWSDPAFWERALDKNDWKAEWITDPQWTPPRTHPVTVTFPAREARYVRLDVTKLGLPLKEGGFPNPVSRLQLAEIEARLGAGPNLAAGAPVTASESFDVAGYWEPRFATDGVLTTEKAPLGYTSLEHADPAAHVWIQLDLGAAKRVDRLVLYPRTDTLTADARTPNFPVDYRILTGDGGPLDTAVTVGGQVEPPPYRPVTAGLPLLARQFSVDKRIRTARLYVAGLGVYAASINGKPVGKSVLDPGNTDVRQRVEYATYDVAQLLRRGGNAIGIELGNGTSNSVDTTRWAKFHSSTATPRALAQLEITYADGTSTTVRTDPTWRSTAGGTTFSSWFGGEDYDARRAPAGWDTPGADLSGWRSAVVIGPPAPQTVLSARSAPPIEVVDTLRTIAVTEPKPGIRVADLGVNFAGWPQLTVSGPAGATVTMRPGELLNADGTVSQATTGSPIYDRYTLSGNGTETWHPRFAYHGFRYVQIEGLPATITGLVLRAANASAGSFRSSNPLVNQIHGIIDRAIQSNMYSVLTDCPHREKLGWLEESHLVFDSVARNYDVAAYYRSIVRKVAEAQTPDGLVPDIAPEYDVFEGGFRDDPNWGGALVLAPLQAYQTYGDVTTLRTYYPAMVRYANYLTGKAKDGLLDYGLGDWIAFDQSTPLGVTATFGYYRVVRALATIATVLGKPGDAARWNSMADHIGQSFNKTYFDAAKHTYATGSQAADAMALDMGIVPAAERSAVYDHLIGNLRANGWLVSVGEIALPSLFRVLPDDVIYKIATQVGRPSYGYQVRHGATSLTERWDGPTFGESQNHFMLGAIDAWFTSGLAGIRQMRGRDLLIKPAVVGDLTAVSGRYMTMYGEVSSDWTRTGNTVRLTVTLPANTTATVVLPDGTSHRVGSGRWTYSLQMAPRSGLG